ncbi:MAG TPA: hypothetical protein VNM14_00055 [Planctomycetota bacterium]|nr:hypothetical protein [Planctomycetota bacterium]
MAKGPETHLFLNKCRARDPRTLLRDCAEYRAKVGDDQKKPLPRVTVFTTTGQSFDGTVVHVQRERDVETVLLHVPDETRPEAVDLVYVAADRVAAVQVHDGEWVAPLLTGGEVARVPSELPQSRLQLKREVREIGQRMTKEFDSGIEVDWDSLPTSDVPNLNVLDLAKGVETAVRKVLRDKLGKEAMKRVRRILLRHQPGARLTCEKDRDGVLLVLDIDKALPDTLDQVVEERLAGAL